MRNDNNSLFDRYDDLEDQINFHFEDVSPDDVDEMAFDFERVVMALFEVVRADDSWICLMHMQTDEVFEPVYLPDDIRVLLEPKDSFLMAIGETSAGWYVLYMSPPYDVTDLHWADSADTDTDTP
ncbi:MAG TPA: hypothetical protein VFV50_17130 [Bdellovibrionales bacterium]|nr:hypothetical protein [Bdellovibrionales bacterium]